MRLFYAAYLTAESMQAYQAFVDSLMAEIPGTVRSVPRSTQHLTLAFLGEVADSEVAQCSSALDAVTRFETFEISLGPPSLLMGRGRPRLIRAGVISGAERIQSVQTALISAVSRHIPSLDTRSKPPHVTLARFKKNASRRQARSVEQAMAGADSSSLPGREKFRSVQLVKSSLTPTGPIYETLREVPLAGSSLR